MSTSPSTRRTHELVSTLGDFLEARLTEDLALLWERDGARPAGSAPGLAAQVAVLDEMLATLAAGALPRGSELRMLLYGYGHHADYDPAWTRLIGDA